jgi:hypothetical protein
MVWTRIGLRAGIKLEELLEMIRMHPQIIGVDPKYIDINIYSCRTLCGDVIKYQYEQVTDVGNVLQGGTLKGKTTTIENVDEETYFQFLSTCEEKKGGSRKSKKQRKQRKSKKQRKQRKSKKLK